MPEIVTLSYKALRSAVQGTAAAFRSITKLQPAAGPEGKIFPATYSQGKYLTEKRRLGSGSRPRRLRADFQRAGVRQYRRRGAA